MIAEETTRDGVPVLQVTLTPEEAERLGWLPEREQLARLAAAGLDLGQVMYATNDSDGNVFYYQHV